MIQFEGQLSNPFEIVPMASIPSIKPKLEV